MSKCTSAWHKRELQAMTMMMEELEKLGRPTGGNPNSTAVNEKWRMISAEHRKAYRTLVEDDSLCQTGQTPQKKQKIENQNQEMKTSSILKNTGKAVATESVVGLLTKKQPQNHKHV